MAVVGRAREVVARDPRLVGQDARPVADHGDDARRPAQAVGRAVHRRRPLVPRRVVDRPDGEPLAVRRVVGDRGVGDPREAGAQDGHRAVLPRSRRRRSTSPNRGSGRNCRRSWPGRPGTPTRSCRPTTAWTLSAALACCALPPVNGSDPIAVNVVAADAGSTPPVPRAIARVAAIRPRATRTGRNRRGPAARMARTGAPDSREGGIPTTFTSERTSGHPALERFAGMRPARVPSSRQQFRSGPIEVPGHLRHGHAHLALRP